MELKNKPPIYAFYLAQDDPKKNTILKLKKFNLLKVIKKLYFAPKKSIILDPFAEEQISIEDRENILKYGLVVIDCSWKKTDQVFKKKFRTGRKLPDLLAANEVNYGKWFKLSSAEALIAALIITDFIDEAFELASKFKWGNEFIKLNYEKFKDRIEFYYKK